MWQTVQQLLIMKHRIIPWLWPKQPQRCILIAIGVWPLMAIITDLIVAPFAHLSEGIDLGLATSNVTAPACLIYGISLWFRAFILDARIPVRWRIAIAVVMLPVWLLAMAVVTLLIFPLGRTSSNF